MTELKRGHEIEWELFLGRLEGTAVCHEPRDALCHQAPTPASGCQCEEWDPKQDESGAWYHEVEIDTDDDVTMVRHDMAPEEDCNIVEFLNNSDLEELCTDRQVKIAATPFVPVWSGDHYEWKPRTTP